MVEATWMRPYYFDATALVKLVVDETESGKLRAFFARASTVVTTTVCLVEALGVLKRKHFIDKTIDENRYFSACFVLVNHAYTNPRHFELDDLPLSDDNVFFEVQDLAKKHGLDVSDALQLGAMRRGKYDWTAGPSSPVLVTGDRGLAAAARAVPKRG